MADKNENPVVDAKAQADAERLYYLGKLKPEDKIPGTVMTIEEGREEYKKLNQQAEEDLQKRTAAYYERQAAKGNKNALPVTETIQTTIVSPVAPLVDVKSSVSGLENLNPVAPVVTEVQVVVPPPTGGDEVFSEYTEEDLKNLEPPKKEKLVAIAVQLGIEGNQIPTKNEDLIELILKTQEDRRKAAT